MDEPDADDADDEALARSLAINTERDRILDEALRLLRECLTIQDLRARCDIAQRLRGLLDQAPTQLEHSFGHEEPTAWETPRGALRAAFRGQEALNLHEGPGQTTFTVQVEANPSGGAAAQATHQLSVFLVGIGTSLPCVLHAVEDGASLSDDVITQIVDAADAWRDLGRVAD